MNQLDRIKDAQLNDRLDRIEYTLNDSYFNFFAILGMIMYLIFVVVSLHGEPEDAIIITAAGTLCAMCSVTIGAILSKLANRRIK